MMVSEWKNCGDLIYDRPDLNIPKCDITVSHEYQRLLHPLHMGDETYWVCPPVEAYVQKRSAPQPQDTGGGDDH